MRLLVMAMIIVFSFYSCAETIIAERNYKYHGEPLH